MPNQANLADHIVNLITEEEVGGNPLVKARYFPTTGNLAININPTVEGNYDKFVEAKLKQLGIDIEHSKSNGNLTINNYKTQPNSYIVNIRAFFNNETKIMNIGQLIPIFDFEKDEEVIVNGVYDPEKDRFNPKLLTIKAQPTNGNELIK